MKTIKTLNLSFSKTMLTTALVSVFSLGVFVNAEACSPSSGAVGHFYIINNSLENYTFETVGDYFIGNDNNVTSLNSGQSVDVLLCSASPGPLSLVDKNIFGFTRTIQVKATEASSDSVTNTVIDSLKNSSGSTTNYVFGPFSTNNSGTTPFCLSINSFSSTGTGNITIGDIGTCKSNIVTGNLAKTK